MPLLRVHQSDPDSPVRAAGPSSCDSASEVPVPGLDPASAAMHHLHALGKLSVGLTIPTKPLC